MPADSTRPAALAGAPPPAGVSKDPDERARLAEQVAWRVTLRGILFVFALVSAVWLLWRLQAVVVQVLLAVILAAGMTPLVERARQREWRLGGKPRRLPRALVVLLMYLGVAAAIVALFVLAVPPLVSEAEDLVSNLPQYAADLQAWVTALPERYPFLPPLDLAQSLGGQLQDVAAQAAAVLGQAVVVLRVALGVLGGVLNGLFVLILALYITADHPRLLRYVVGFLPADRQARGERVAERIGDRLGGWLRGQLTLSAIIGAMTLVGLWLIGVRYAVLLAIVAAVGEAIPLIGPIISAVPAVIIAFFNSSQQGLFTIGLYVLVQQLENNLVVPKVMEKAVALNPMVVMVALLAGGELLGITGAVLSVPVAAGLSVLLDVVRSERQADAAAWGEPVPDQPELLTSPPTKSSDDAPPPDGRKAASGQDPEHARRAA